MGTFFHLHKMWRHLFFFVVDIFSYRYSIIITFLTVFIGTQPTAFFVTGNCSRELFVWTVSGGFLLSQVKNVGAVSLLQIGLFLHKFLTALNLFLKYNNVLTRTDLFSLEPKNDRKAHRIELCKHFNSKLPS